MTSCEAWLAVSLLLMAAAVAAEPVKVTAEHRLFLDDELVAASERVQRTFHQPTKHPQNPIFRPEKPWEGTTLVLNGTVIRDPATGLWRMYYGTFENPGKFLVQPRTSFVCLATSTDGLHWTRPVLRNVTVNGSDENNIVVPHTCADLLQVTYDDHDPDPNRRWKLSVFQYNLEVFAYERAMANKEKWDKPRPSHTGVCLYWSADGLRNWQKGPEGVIRGAGDVTIAGWDPKRGKYVAYVKTGHEKKRARAMAESDDFTQWPKPELIVHADAQDPPDLEMYSMEGWPYESMWLGYLRTFHNGSSYKVDTQLVYSYDGRRWLRPAGRPVFLPNGPDDAWDRGYHTMSNNPPVRVGDELWIYYGSTNNTKKQRPYAGGIGLAKLRVDGFASLDAGTDDATLTTKPLLLAGKTLCLNAALAGGSLTVEVLDAAGKVIGGYEAAACRALTADAVRQEVRWATKADVSALAGQPVQLRLRWRHGRVYGCWVEG